MAFVCTTNARTYVLTYAVRYRLQVRVGLGAARASMHKRQFSCSLVRLLFRSIVVLSFLLCLRQWRTYEEKEWQDTFGDSFLASCKFVEQAVLEFANTSGFRRGRSCTTWVTISSLLHTAKEESCAAVWPFARKERGKWRRWT